MEELNLQRSFEEIISDLTRIEYSYTVLFQALASERKGYNRKAVCIAIGRVLTGNKKLDIKSILSAVQRVETRRRKRIVRKIYKETTIWAMEEIRNIYPEYTYEMLEKDLLVKKPKRKVKLNFRINQQATIVKELRTITDVNSKEYHALCNRFAWHQNNMNKPIILIIRKNSECYEFSFPSSSKEETIKNFAKRALSKTTTIEEIFEMRKRISMRKHI